MSSRVLGIAIGVVLALVSRLSPAAESDLTVARMAWYAHEFATVLRIYTPLAQQGNQLAQERLGEIYNRGLGVPQDAARAKAYFHAAAENAEARATDPASMFAVAKLYDSGDGLPKDKSKAFAWYGKAAALSYSDAYINLVAAARALYGDNLNPAQAVAWMQKAVDQGNPVAEANLANWYRSGWGVERDDAKAEALDYAAALQDYPLAEADYGAARADAGDAADAMVWLQKAADHGDPFGQYRLCLLYYDASDYAHGLPLCRQAAAQELPAAQDTMGRIYLYGKGVARDEVQALAWFRKSADQGYYDAQYMLGLMAEQRNEMKEAHGWYAKSAQQGFPDAEDKMGWMYLNGIGVDKNPDTAVAWLQKAAAQGSQYSNQVLEELMANNNQQSRPIQFNNQPQGPRYMAPGVYGFSGGWNALVPPSAKGPFMPSVYGCSGMNGMTAACRGWW